jgi:hypothetical protein
MKSRYAQLSLLTVVLALAAQLFFISPTTHASQNTNSSTTTTTTTTTMTQNGNVGIPSSACRRRCNRNYRRCIRGWANSRRCRIQLRNCLRQCPQ